MSSTKVESHRPLQSGALIQRSRTLSKRLYDKGLCGRLPCVQIRLKGSFLHLLALLDQATLFQVLIKLRCKRRQPCTLTFLLSVAAYAAMLMWHGNCLSPALAAERKPSANHVAKQSTRVLSFVHARCPEGHRHRRFFPGTLCGRCCCRVLAT